MKVRIDQMKCDTSGICVKACPELFRFQEGSKRAEATVEEVPSALQGTCLDIARRCPTGAIIVER